jgi:hypothetical protein
MCISTSKDIENLCASFLYVDTSFVPFHFKNRSYTILCGAWARSGQKIAPQRCLQILAHMVERHRLGYPNVKPNG